MNFWSWSEFWGSCMKQCLSYHLKQAPRKKNERQQSLAFIKPDPLWESLPEKPRQRITPIILKLIYKSYNHFQIYFSSDSRYISFKIRASLIVFTKHHFRIKNVFPLDRFIRNWTILAEFCLVLYCVIFYIDISV